MNIYEAQDIVDLYEKYEDRCCTCFQGHAPCGYCELMPDESSYLLALTILDNAERNG